MTIRRCYIVVPASAQGAANDLAESMDPDNGSGTFSSVRLSSDATTPVTHYGANTAVLTDAQTFVDAYQNAEFEVHLYGTEDRFGGEGQVYHYDSGWQTLGQGTVQDVALNGLGLQRITEELS